MFFFFLFVLGYEINRDNRCIVDNRGFLSGIPAVSGWGKTFSMDHLAWQPDEGSLTFTGSGVSYHVTDAEPYWILIFYKNHRVESGSS
jgi:hypothetical protein